MTTMWRCSKTNDILSLGEGKTNDILPLGEGKTNAILPQGGGVARLMTYISTGWR